MLREMLAGRRMRGAVLSGVILSSVSVVGKPAFAQASFDVAVIHPSSGEVKFEHNGKTEPLVTGPPSIREVHYDITAKTDPGSSKEQMQAMMRTLLSERFKLLFHVEKKELRVYTLTVAKGGIKMRPSAPGLAMHHENSATGMVANSISMQELAAYLSDPLGAPLTDGTGLPGRYDFIIDFTPYVNLEQSDVRPDPVSVLRAALKGDLGLDLLQGKAVVDVMVVDHVGPPSSN